MKALSIILTCALLGVMGWLILSSSKTANATNAKNAAGREPAPTIIAPNDAAQLAAIEAQLLANQANKQATLPSPFPAPTPNTYPPSAQVGSTPNVTAALQAANAAPMPETPRQRQIKAAPPIAEVMEYHADEGVVGLTAGKDRKIEAGMGFAVRRGNAIIARVTVIEVEGNGAVASVNPRSVPPGVVVQVGDEVIQDLPPES
jgi:hypothetical protein